MEWVMTEWFIRRPIGSSLLMLSLVVAGILGYSELPVDNIPELDFPTLVVTASAEGASATYMERALHQCTKQHHHRGAFSAGPRHE